jgi:hypothetical protein
MPAYVMCDNRLLQFIKWLNNESSLALSHKRTTRGRRVVLIMNITKVTIHTLVNQMARITVVNLNKTGNIRIMQH